MLEQLTPKQLDAAYRQFTFFLCVLLTEQTGERRSIPSAPEDDPLFWNLGTYPKAVALLRELVNAHC